MMSFLAKKPLYCFMCGAVSAVFAHVKKEQWCSYQETLFCHREHMKGIEETPTNPKIDEELPTMANETREGPLIQQSNSLSSENVFDLCLPVVFFSCYRFSLFTPFFYSLAFSPQ